MHNVLVKAYVMYASQDRRKSVVHSTLLSHRYGSLISRVNTSYLTSTAKHLSSYVLESTSAPMDHRSENDVLQLTKIVVKTTSIMIQWKEWQLKEVTHASHVQKVPFHALKVIFVKSVQLGNNRIKIFTVVKCAHLELSRIQLDQ